MASSLAIPVEVRSVTSAYLTGTSPRPRSGLLELALGLEVAGLLELALGLELARVQGAQLAQGRGLARPLVVADARDAGEAQGQTRRVGRAPLDLVVGHLHHDLGADAHGVPVVAGGQAPQPLRHLAELQIGQPLEGLAHLGEALALYHREVIVGQPARAAPRAAIRGHDHAVDGVGALELEPPLASTPRRVEAGEVLGHDALVTGGEGP